MKAQKPAMFGWKINHLQTIRPSDPKFLELSMCNLGLGLLCRYLEWKLSYEWPIQVSAGLQSASLDKCGPLLTWNSHFSTAKVCKTALKKTKTNNIHLAWSLFDMFWPCFKPPPIQSSSAVSWAVAPGTTSMLPWLTTQKKKNWAVADVCRIFSCRIWGQSSKKTLRPFNPETLVVFKISIHEVSGLGMTHRDRIHGNQSDETGFVLQLKPADYVIETGRPQTEKRLGFWNDIAFGVFRSKLMFSSIAYSKDF